ncbi:MAG: outer membrane protein transport protein [bacterium]
MHANRSRQIALALGCFAVLHADDALAAGFAVAEQGAAALGQGNAVTGTPDATGASMFNPAAVTTSGLFAGGTITAVAPFSTHEDETSTTSEFGIATPPALHVGFVTDSPLVLGGVVGLNVPFGATLAWPADWSGRFEVTRISLQVFEVSGNAIVGYRTPTFSVQLAAGPRLLRSTVELQRNVDAVDTEGKVELGGAATALSYQVATFAQIHDLGVGVSFRPGATLSYEGSADFQQIPIELAVAAHDQDVKTSVDLPTRIAAGLSYDLGLGRVSADVEYFGWSSFKSFGIDFDDPNTPDVNEPRNWSDTVAIRAGYEHRAFDSPLRLRGGLVWDPTPSPDDTLSPTLPDGNRVVVSVGATWSFGPNIDADLGFAHVTVLEKEAEGEDVFPGRYSGFAEILSLGTRMRF